MTKAHGTYPFSVELQDQDEPGWSTMTANEGASWELDGSVLTIRNTGPEQTSVSLYPGHAWFGLRYFELNA